MFPTDPLGARIELLIDGIWTDVTSDVYLPDGIQHRRGRTSADGGMDPASGSLTLKSPDGRYSNRDPMSRYYQKLGRGTRLRVRLPAPEEDTYLAISSGQDYASTPATGLGLTGDLDVRVEAHYDDWSAPGDPLKIIGVWASASASRGWMLTLWHRTLVLYWSPNGTAQIIKPATVTFTPPASGRMAVRATLDTDNGTSGNTVTFYTAESMAGPWTQLGAPVVTAGVTSIFGGAPSLDVGAVSGSTFGAALGGVYKAEVRSGIDGAVVAAPDFTTRPVGTAPFTDSAGRPWSVTGTGVSAMGISQHFGLEISEMVPRWAPGAHAVRMPVTGAGILLRLGTGAKALGSALRRRIPSASPLAYWPMEDGADTTGAYSPIAGVSPLALSNATWASADSLPSSGPLPVLASSNGDLAVMSGRVPPPVGTTTGWQVRWIYRLDSVPTTLWTFMRIVSTGTVTEWYLQARDNLSRILGRDADGNAVVDQSVTTGPDLFNQWTSTRLEVSQSAGTVNWQIVWQDVGGDAGAFAGAYSGTAGRVTSVGSPPDGFAAALDGMALGHIAVFGTPSTSAYDGAITAYAGETALSRLARLCQEEAIPLRLIDGDTTIDSERMGPQRPAAILDLLSECDATDGGILYETREAPALTYRDRTSLYNQTPAIVLDYARGEAMPPMEPTDDLKAAVNDMEVTRSGGSTARAVLETGPLSVLAPPDGIGQYNQAVTLNLYSDEQADLIASWLVHLGTVDAPRVPAVKISLHRHPHLIPAVKKLDIGDIVRIINLPRWVAAGTLDLRAEGYSQDIRVRTWDVILNCSPGEPWRIAEMDPVAVENFESASPSVTIAAGGALPWTRTNTQAHTGSWSLRSGAITANQTSEAIIELPETASEVSVWYRVRSEAAGPGFAGDRLTVLVDDVQQLLAQGTVDWTPLTLDVTGAAQVTFRYAKDNSTSVGEDAAYIDDLQITTTTDRAPRPDTDGTVLAAALNPTSATVTVTTAGQPWIDSATYPTEFPFAIVIGGEEMQVKVCTGTGPTQTFSVTRSVNGIVKSHSAGATVELANPAIVAL